MKMKVDRSIRTGTVYAEKFTCEDGSVWCTIWYPDDSNKETGMCFDFSFKDIDQIIDKLCQLKNDKFIGEAI